MTTAEDRAHCGCPRLDAFDCLEARTGMVAVAGIDDPCCCVCHDGDVEDYEDD